MQRHHGEEPNMITPLTLLIAATGIAYSITTGVYNVSGTPSESIASVYQKAFDDFFILLNIGISCVAWILFLSTAGTVTPLVASLLIMAEAIFVIKELINIAIFCWYGAPKINPHARPVIHHQTPLVIAFDGHRNKTWVNLISALWLTALVAAWCLMPEIIAVGALSLVGMALVHWQRSNAMDDIETTLKITLQRPMDERGAWWDDGHDSQMGLPVQINLMASNDAQSNIDLNNNWHQINEPDARFASQAGIFSKKSGQRITEGNVLDDKTRSQYLHRIS